MDTTKLLTTPFIN